MKQLFILLLISFSFSFIACGSKDKQDSEQTKQVVKSEKQINLADYPNQKLFVQADSLKVTQVNPNVTRRIAYLDDLMVTIIEFNNGPMAEPDPFHSHPHEQISYIAEGECLVLIGDRQMKLGKGDIFAVPSNVPHSVQSLTPYLKLIDSFSPVRQDFIKK